ncbi:MAG: type II 3-dehydroquinate dehydratase [Actinobacteria bacterium]|uniref:3-dehydroquinate dehydratase n=1 Tax=freshwater metagenome TaxID=449393 RepID=A0A6J6E584_9ZZZZ|nr:type II 3-dehydroquinate dehydratase [Actinomycetota bacterium]MTA32916.1 type II 3-dehydroquinate dehydratase [Actinomycetota bacterium]
MNSVLILNGPNLGRLGSREPEIYGSLSLADIEAILRADVPEDVALRFEQTDDEATLMGFLHEALDARMGVILNPAAFTHYSYAIRDACAMVTSAGLPLIEVHLSNPHSREEFRHRSVISGVATGVILGFGADSYRLAMTQMMTLLGR